MAYGRLVGINNAKLLSNCCLLDSEAVQLQGPGALCISERSKPAGIFEDRVAKV